MFETKSCYCCVARQALPCYTAVAQLGFKHRAKAKFNSVNLVRHSSSTTFETGLRQKTMDSCGKTESGEFSKFPPNVTA